MFHSHFLHFSSWSLSPLVWGCPSPVLLEFPVFLVLSGYQGPDIIFNPHIGWDNFWKKHPPNWQQLSRKPLKPDWPKKKIRMIDFSLSVTVIIQYQYHYCFSSKFLTFILKYRIFLNQDANFKSFSSTQTTFSFIADAQIGSLSSYHWSQQFSKVF